MTLTASSRAVSKGFHRQERHGALVLAEYAASEELDLGESIAYADSASDLPLLECVGFPVAVNPEAKLAAIAAQKGLAHRALGTCRRRLEVDRTHGPLGQRHLALVGPSRCITEGPVRALVLERNFARFAAARVVATLSGSGRAASVGPLRLVDTEPPELPGPDWRRVEVLLAGICGSDLATLDGHSSRYFDDLVSFPFVPGHEIVGVVSDHGSSSGTGRESRCSRRVVVEPAIGCVARGISPVCGPCSEGHTGGCRTGAFGNLSAGLQIGYCADTGGGWSAAGLVAHVSQLHDVPEGFSDEEAVIVEPTACAVHAALAAEVGDDAVVAVLGAGTIGLATMAALHHLAPPRTLIVGPATPTSASWRKTSVRTSRFCRTR